MVLTYNYDDSRPEKGENDWSKPKLWRFSSVFVNIYGAQESIPRNRLRYPT
jgi:hypothetical protein